MSDRPSAGGRLRPDARTDLLLRAALGPLDLARAALGTWREGEDLRDPGMATLRLLPLLEGRLAELAPDDAPLALRVKHVARFAWLRQQTLLTRTGPALAALRDQAIDVLLIKGAALIQVPGIPARRRMMDDLDVLVRGEDLLGATQALESAGLRSPFAPFASRDLARLRGLGHAAPFDDGRGAEIDLHWHALHNARHPDADVVWWEDARPAIVRDVAVLAAPPSDILVQSVAHGNRWAEGGTARWAADLSLLLSAAGDDLDWDRVVRIATDRRIAGLVGDALDYVAEVADVAVPVAPRAALHRAPRPLVERLRARRQIDPADGGPVAPGRFGRVVEAYEDRVSTDLAPGAATGPAVTARLLAREWSVSGARAVPAEAAFLLAGRPWPLRRLLRRWRHVPEKAPTADRPVYVPGTELLFVDDLVGNLYLAGGWYYSESFGVWGRGARGRVVLPFAPDRPAPTGLVLGASLIGYVTEYARPMNLEIVVNDVVVTRRSYSDPACPLEHVRAIIPDRAVAGWNRLEILFVARPAITPADARDGGDLRRLGIGLHSLAVSVER